MIDNSNTVEVKDGKTEFLVYSMRVAKLDSDIRTLTAERDALRAKSDDAESMLASLADCVAAALRNSGMSDAGIGLDTDLCGHIWRLSYKIVEYRIKMALPHG